VVSTETRTEITAMKSEVPRIITIIVRSSRPLWRSVLRTASTSGRCSQRLGSRASMRSKKPAARGPGLHVQLVERGVGRDARALQHREQPSQHRDEDADRDHDGIEPPRQRHSFPGAG
jgi:hypothetical protein